MMPLINSYNEITLALCFKINFPLMTANKLENTC